MAGLLLAPLAAASTPPGPVPTYPRVLQACDGVGCATATLEEFIVVCGPAGSGWWGVGGYWCRFHGEYSVTQSSLGCWSLTVSQPFADDTGPSSARESLCDIPLSFGFDRTDWHFAPMTRTDTITSTLCFNGACAQLAVPVTYTAD